MPLAGRWLRARDAATRGTGGRLRAGAPWMPTAGPALGTGPGARQRALRLGPGSEQLCAPPFLVAF